MAKQEQKPELKPGEKVEPQKEEQKPEQPKQEPKKPKPNLKYEIVNVGAVIASIPTKDEKTGKPLSLGRVEKLTIAVNSFMPGKRLIGQLNFKGEEYLILEKV